MKTFAFIALGATLACVIGALCGFATRTPTTVDLTPTVVMVLAREAAEGTEVTAAAAKEYPVPATFVTESMIRATDWPKLAGHKFTFAAQKGDVLTWQHFAPIERQRATQRCVLALHDGVEAAAAARLTAEANELQLDELTPSAPPPAPKGATIRVVGLAKDLHEGDELTSASLRIIEVPRAFFTESLILESDQGQVIGAKVVSALTENDLLNWPLLRRDSVVGANTCVARLTAAAHTARLDFATKSVSTFETRGATP